MSSVSLRQAVRHPAPSRNPDPRFLSLKPNPKSNPNLSPPISSLKPNFLADRQVIAAYGVAWRRTPQFEDRVGAAAVERGAVVRATQVVTGSGGIMFAYVPASDEGEEYGWLPITTVEGTVVLRPAGEGDSTPRGRRRSSGLAGSPTRGGPGTPRRAQGPMRLD